MKNKIWNETYRPKTIDQLILPERTMEMLRKYRDSGDIPNLLLHSNGPGTGKTSAAKALANDLGLDVMVVNGSDSAESGVDALRTSIKSFASSMSLEGKKKMIIIDECDYLGAHTVMPALRHFTESFSKNCIFVFTCNYVNRIIEPLRSRLSLVEFTIPNDEKKQILRSFHKRVTEILDKEGVQYDSKVVAQFIVRHFPDFRKTINDLQMMSYSGMIDKSVLSSTKDEELKRLFEVLKTKNFTEMRKWVAENIDIGSADIIRSLFDSMDEHIKAPSIPTFVVILGEYQAKAAVVADLELNLVACLTELMSEAEFK